MAQFFKYFFASLLAIFVFLLLIVFLLVGLAGALASKEKVVLDPHSVLYLDLSQTIREQTRDNPFGRLTGADEEETPGLYDILQMIQFAKGDDHVDGIYLKCGSDANGFATNEEIRNALKNFRESGKFVLAFGEVIPQKAYHVANIADKVYVHPKGGLDWKGLGIQYIFFKKALDKLEIEPQIFYAGKFKSATEPFRAEQMTDANKLQSKVLLDDLYNYFIDQSAQSRKLDTSKLKELAGTHAINSAADAMRAGLVDGMRYEDEVKEEIRRKTGAGSIDEIHFVSFAKYAEAANYKGGKGTDRIALIYAQGDIVDGGGNEDQIGGDRFRKYIRQARLDKKVKAIVVRINSGGGSAMASENMWREISLAKKDKPVVVSYGDVAASGGYYMACNADSIFALPNTITGSIGVFSIIPNLQGFFKDKLGVTFDGVETSPYANSPSIAEPLSEAEKRFLQQDVDSIYQTFLTRVADGRRLALAQVDSIAQGRVWAGNRAITIGLVDRIGGISDAMKAAAKLAGLKDYRVKEYPEELSLIDKLTGAYRKNVQMKSLQRELGEDFTRYYREWQSVRSTIGTAQAKMPVNLIIQ